MESVQTFAQDAIATITTYPYNIIAGSLAAGVGLYFARRFFAGGVCYSKASLTGKTVIITGGNTGIGKETAVDLARRNARVILACRSVEKGEKAAVDIRRESGSDNVIFRQLDLASLASIRQFAAQILEEEPRIDILINNAGVMMCPYSQTEDGFEMQFGTNHLGHFLLTNLLLERIIEAPAARIVNVSSRAYLRGRMNFDDLNWNHTPYNRMAAYSQSKLANVLFTRALAKRLEGSNATANVLHPGLVDTELQRHIWLMKVVLYPVALLTVKTPTQGAQTSIYCAVSEEMEGVSGQYLADCRVQELKTAQAKDVQAPERLWEISAQMVGLEEEQ